MAVILEIENTYLTEQTLDEILLKMLLESNACSMRIQDMAERISEQEVTMGD